MIKINAGWIVDGLIIAQPGKQVLHGGGQGGDQTIIALDSDEFIRYLSGSNDFFDGAEVTANVRIITNKRQFGPFGKYSGIHGYGFELNIGDFRLANDRRNKYLGPIKEV